MKDSAGNELHVGDRVLYRRPHSRKWERCDVVEASNEEVIVEFGGPLDRHSLRDGRSFSHTVDEPHRLKKVQQTVDPHETVTKIFGKKEGPRP